MIDRSLFTPQHDNPPMPVPIDDLSTVPTEQMAYLLADLLGDAQDVLEIGTGSGYQTAVLAERCRSVVSLEVRPQPGVSNKLPGNVALIVGNGYEMDLEEQFDAVLVTFAASRISLVWANELRQGGRLVLPLEIQGVSQIRVYERIPEGLKLVDVVAYANFTPGVEA